MDPQQSQNPYPLADWPLDTLPLQHHLMLFTTTTPFCASVPSKTLRRVSGSWIRDQLELEQREQ